MTTVLTTTYDSVVNTNAITITLASLATSSTLLAGRQSTIVDNTSNKFIDAILFGQITAGTTLTAGNIAVYVFAPIKIVSSTASYPTATATALTESDGAATFESGQLGSLKLAGNMVTNTTNSRVYTLEPVSVASLFGGVLPPKWGIWVTQSTNANLDATAGNHWMHYTGITYTNT